MSVNEVNKKKEEMRLAQLFYSLNSDTFNHDFHIEPFEKPDVIMRNDDKVIGLELTRLPNLYSPKQSECLDLIYPKRNLLLKNNQGKESSQFPADKGVVLPYLTSEIIQDVIDRKNKLLKGYEKFDENWLLIHFGHGFADEFDQTWRNTLFELTSDFNRVYLLDERFKGFSKRVFKE